MANFPNVSLSERMRQADALIVGSGFFGATIAERMASNGYHVVVIDSRNHIAGNAFSETDAYSGVEIHRYGSHLFHTSNQKVWDYAQRFTKFNEYRHVVWTTHKNKVYPMPINLATMSAFYGTALSPSQARALVQAERNEEVGDPANLEEKGISLIGRSMYEAFIRGYTAKQWQTSPVELPAAVISRLPVRFNYNNRYFTDTWEGLPLKGYTEWVRAMLNSPQISVHLNTDFFEIRSLVPTTLPVIFTGPIDRYFDYKEGQLGWRTLDFHLEHHATEDVLGTAVMNYADEEIPYTRVHEFKHLHPERQYRRDRSVVMYEYSRFAKPEDEPYYPVNTVADRKTLGRYRERARNERNVFFGGRLGSYQYLDMHMAIASALTFWDNQLQGYLAAGPRRD